MYTEDQIEAAAQAAHEVNKTYCREVMGDNVHLFWKDSPEDLRESTREGVRQIARTPAVTPEESHENWTKYKSAHGWVYGEKKDYRRRTHPCLVPYEKLPMADRVKDALFHLVVKASLGIDDGGEEIRPHQLGQ